VEERRQEDPRIDVLETKLEHILNNQKLYSEEAKEWRTRFCLKLDKVTDKLGNLPCDRRAYLSNQVKAIWAIIVLIVGAIVGEWVKK